MTQVETVTNGAARRCLALQAANQRRRLTRREMIRGSLAVTGGLALAPILTSCGDDDTTGTTSGQQATIDYWYAEYWTSGMEPLLTKFRKEYPNITVNARSYPEYPAIVEAVQAALAAGEPPALAHIGYPWLRYATAALPHPTIEEVAENTSQTTDWLTENFASNILDLGRVEGALHGIPQVMGATAIFYNREVFEQAGLDRAPGSWQEVREYAQQIKDRTGNFGLYVAEQPGFFNEEALVESNGGQMLLESGGSFRTGVDAPEAVEALQLVADMVLRDKTAAHLTPEQGIQSFTSGEIAMLINPSADFDNYQESSSFEVGIAGFPAFGDRQPRLPIGGTTNMIFATDPDQQAAALELVRFFSKPRSFTTFVEDTYLLPPRPEMLDDPQYLEDFVEREPAMEVAAESLEYAEPFTSWPGEDGLQAIQVLVDARSRYLSGEQDVKTALGEAARRIDELIGS